MARRLVSRARGRLELLLVDRAENYSGSFLLLARKCKERFGCQNLLIWISNVQIQIRNEEDYADGRRVPGSADLDEGAVEGPRLLGDRDPHAGCVPRRECR